MRQALATTLLLFLLGASARGRADEPVTAPPRPLADWTHDYAIGARLRGVFVTPAMLAPFVQTTSSLQSMSGGVEFIYRRRTYDVVTSLDLMFAHMQDGNFLGNGHDPSQDTHFVQFGGFGQLSLLSIDVSIIGHTKLARWLELRYGAGVGLGLMLGDVMIVNNGRQCTAQNFTDGKQCYPRSQDGTVDAPLGRPDSEAKLKATEKAGAIDLADTPHRHATNDKPPVLVVINVLVGLRFQVHKHLAFDVELGFRDAIFVGGGFHVLF